MCYGECDLGIADDGGRGRRRQFGDVPASSHPLRDGSMTMRGVGNTEPCSRTLVLPSHHMKLYRGDSKLAIFDRRRHFRRQDRGKEHPDFFYLVFRGKSCLVDVGLR